MIASLVLGLAHALLYAAMTVLGLVWLVSDTSDARVRSVHGDGQ